MKYGTRMKMTAICVGLVLAQFEAGFALADSAIGVDTALGNALNPPGRTSVPREVDPDGVDTVRRSPTGQLYGLPALPATQTQTESGWSYNGGVEAGIVGIGKEGQKNSVPAAQFRQYKDIRNGLYLNYFEADAEKPDTASFMQIFGGGTGQGDQFLGTQFGRYNDWKVKAFYNETTHVFTDTWKSLYNGEGTGTLTTGLQTPKMVTSGAMVSGTTPNYFGPSATCSPTAPCWSYVGVDGITRTYGNAVAYTGAGGPAGISGGINGVTGTMINGPTSTTNTTTGAVTNVASTGVMPVGAGATQSNMAAAIFAKLNATPYSELSLVRKKGGVRGDITLSDNWKGYASYTLENRVGARPFAMNDNNISTEIAEPIDYNTHDILMGLSYKDERNQANLRASASIFQNSINTLNVQYALLGSASVLGTVNTGIFTLPPDNNAFNLKGEFARSLPDFFKGRFTAAASYGVNRQNDALLSPLSAAQYAGVIASSAANAQLYGNWTTTDALSRKTAGQEIDNKLIDLGLSLKPVDDLSVKGTFRTFETVNKGGYMAYNPLTGEFGRGYAGAQALGTLDVVKAPSGVLNSAGVAGCYAPPGFATVDTCSAAALTNGANIPVFGQARSTKQTNYTVSADYDLNRISSLNGSLEREEFNRNFRERDKTWEDKAKLGYVNRALGDTTLRASYEMDNKRGGAYNYRTFGDLGTGLPGLDPATQIQNVNQLTGAGLTVNGVTYPNLAASLLSRYSYYFRKYDQADRDQKILNTRVNFLARQDLDLGLNLQMKRADYPNSFYGMKKDNQDSLGLDLNYQPSTVMTVSAFYNYQNGKKTMSLNSGVATTGTSSAASCTVANLNLYGYSACSDTTDGINGPRPDGSRWSSETTDRNDVIGFGLQEDLGFARLGIDYTYTKSSTHIAYNFGNQPFAVGPSVVTNTGTNLTTPAQAAANNAAMAALAGSALPDMTTLQNTITINLVKPIDKKSSVRVSYRYEDSKIADWHYDNVIKNVMAAYDSGTLLLDSGPLNSHVGVFAVMYQLKM